MNKLCLAAAMFFLLALASCAAEIPGDAPEKSPQTIQETTTQTTLPPWEFDPTRLPSWAIEAGLTAEDEEVRIVHHELSLIRNVEERIARTTGYIVRVEVLNERVDILERWSSSYDIFTIYRLRVLEVFYGNTQASDVIEARQIGGRWGNLERYNREFVPITTGGEYIMFLNGVYPNIHFHPCYGVYRATGADPLERVMPNRVNLPTIHWSLTLDDLQQLTMED